MDSRAIWVFGALLFLSVVFGAGFIYFYMPDVGDDGYHDGYPVKLADSAEPSDELHVNVYQENGEVNWIREEEFSMDDFDETAFEVTRYPDEIPTEEQLHQAWELYNSSFNAAEENNWFDFDNAVEDGYEMEGAQHHWINIQNLSIHTDEHILDPQHPESLVYLPNPEDEEEKILAGYMYHQPLGSDSEAPQTGGPLTVWHFHDMYTANYAQHLESIVSMKNAIEDDEELFDELDSDFDGLDEFQEQRDRTAEMLHVWFVEHPEGPFGTSMNVPEESLEDKEKLTEKEFKRYLLENHRD